LPRPYRLSRPNERAAAPQHRINEHIRLTPIRLIGVEGEPIGIIPTAEAQARALEAGLDLVEVAPNERPPVCKLMDYGKFLYQQSHKAKKSKTHQQKLKEIRVRPKIGDHDVDTKVGQARKFLEHHDRVQVYVVFRGREMQHVEEGRRVLAAFVEKLADFAKVERAPLLEGKRLVVMLAPKA
jgi:translation initiation factor IF-3